MITLGNLLESNFISDRTEITLMLPIKGTPITHRVRGHWFNDQIVDYWDYEVRSFSGRVYKDTLLLTVVLGRDLSDD